MNLNHSDYDKVMTIFALPAEFDFCAMTSLFSWQSVLQFHCPVSYNIIYIWFIFSAVIGRAMNMNLIDRGLNILTSGWKKKK